MGLKHALIRRVFLLDRGDLRFVLVMALTTVGSIALGNLPLDMLDSCCLLESQLLRPQESVVRRLCC